MPDILDDALLVASAAITDDSRFMFANDVGGTPANATAVLSELSIAIRNQAIENAFIQFLFKTGNPIDENFQVLVDYEAGNSYQGNTHGNALTIEPLLGTVTAVEAGTYLISATIQASMSPTVFIDDGGGDPDVFRMNTSHGGTSSGTAGSESHARIQSFGAASYSQGLNSTYIALLIPGETVAIQYSKLFAGSSNSLLLGLCTVFVTKIDP